MQMRSLLYLIFLTSTFLFSQENVKVLSVLPTEVSETSGLVFYNGKLITHNDSGGTAQLFEIDTVSYEITRTITIASAINTDWEDIAQDADYIYIGDFGNNVGIRTDLGVYRISKQDYDQSDTVQADRIDFAYQDQTEFTNTGNSDWDAEAFFVLGDQLIILTKQWKSSGTIAYSIPKIPGNYTATRLDDYAIDGLVTGATYNFLSNDLFLVGYSGITAFVTRIENITPTAIFGGTITKSSLRIGIAQVEAIAYSDIDTYFVSCEFLTRPGITIDTQLFQFDVDDETEPEPEPEPEPQPEPEPELLPELDDDEIIIYKGRLFDFLEYHSGIEEPILKRSIFDALGREIQFANGDEIENNQVDLSTLQNGIYYLTFYYSDSKKSIPFYKD
jgi:hypothetical protein